jgi:hypothetical protein
MKTKLLLVLLMIGLHYTTTAQVAHDYKPNCCRLAGATFSTEKSCYCSGCAAVDKKNAEAKAAEDKRVKEIVAKKEEEKKQKAIAEAKRQKEELDKKAKDSKANVVHLGFRDTKKVKAEKTSIAVNKNIVKEKLTILEEVLNKKYSLINKYGDKILTITNGKISKLDDWADRQNLFLIEEYSPEYSVNVINEKGEKLINKESISSIINCENGYFMVNTLSIGDGTSTYDCYQGYMFSVENKTFYPLPNLTEKYNSTLVATEDFIKKEHFYPEAEKKWIEIINSPDFPKENVSVIVSVLMCSNDPNKTGNDRDFYYFNKIDKKWKLLMSFKTRQDFNNYFR